MSCDVSLKVLRTLLNRERRSRHIYELTFYWIGYHLSRITFNVEYIMFASQ